MNNQKQEKCVKVPLSLFVRTLTYLETTESAVEYDERVNQTRRDLANEYAAKLKRLVEHENYKPQKRV